MSPLLEGIFIGIVSGAIGGGIVVAGAGFINAGIRTGVWNPLKQLKRVQEEVPKIPFSERWATWLTYTANVNARGSNNNTPFHQLVREIALEFASSYPHPDFPPGSMPTGFAALPLPGVPFPARIAMVNAAIDKVRSMRSDTTKYPPMEMAELLTYLNGLLN
jgi:hypothetical protein